MNKWKIIAGVVSVFCIFSILNAEPPGGVLNILDDGTISGTVTYGINPLPGFHIVTRDSLENIVNSAFSDSSGAWLVNLPPGTYHEHMTKVGYNVIDIFNIIVNSGDTTFVSVNFPAEPAHYVVGDVNNNGTFNGVDVVYAVSYFKGGLPPPYGVLCGSTVWFVAGDVNGSCDFNGVDVTYMVSYFKGGAFPQPCPICPPVLRKLN
jgi:hypothetical protein